MLKSYSALFLQRNNKYQALWTTGFCFLINPILSVTFCWWPALGQPVSQITWAGVQASRTRSMTFFGAWFPVQDGLVCINLGKGHSLCFTRGKWRSNAQTCVLSANWFLFISLPSGWNCLRVLKLQWTCLFRSAQKKSKIQEKILDSPQPDVRDTKREMQTFTAGPLSN